MMNGRIGTLAILITTFSTQGSADSIEDFYRGKQLSMTIATSAGNDYDFRARLLARHMPKYIPGNPQILSRNMPGGGGIVNKFIYSLLYNYRCFSHQILIFVLAVRLLRFIKLWRDGQLYFY